MSWRTEHRDIDSVGNKTDKNRLPAPINLSIFCSAVESRFHTSTSHILVRNHCVLGFIAVQNYQMKEVFYLS
jgi:hypothetical protein